MLNIDQLCQAAPTGLELVLPFEARQKSRLLTQLADGEPVGLFLPRGTVLRGGDHVRAADGRVVRVVAKPEHVLHVTADSPIALARIAYHLGNRHVALQVGDGYLRLLDDAVLDELVRRLGGTVEPRIEPFEPEAGAYSGHSHTDAAGTSHGGKIHQFGRVAGG